MMHVQKYAHNNFNLYLPKCIGGGAPGCGGGLQNKEVRENIL